MKKFKIAGYKFYKNYEDYEDKEIKDLKEEISDIYKKISEETERDKKVSSEFIDKVFPAEKAGKMKEELYYRMFNSNLRKLLKAGKLVWDQEALLMFVKCFSEFLLDYLQIELPAIKAGKKINPVLKENFKLGVKAYNKVIDEIEFKKIDNKNLKNFINNLYLILWSLWREIEDEDIDADEEGSKDLVNVIKSGIEELLILRRNKK